MLALNAKVSKYAAQDIENLSDVFFQFFSEKYVTTVVGEEIVIEIYRF